MFVTKKVRYHTVSTHDLYKLFTFAHTELTASGITINQCIAPPSPSMSDKEITSSYNHYFLRHNFYSIYNNSGFFSYNSKYYNQNNNVLQERTSFISIPVVDFGKRILQGSLSIVGNTTLTDDGNGNLIDSSIPTTYLVPSTNLKAWFSFDDAYIAKEFPYSSILTLRDNSFFLNKLLVVNPKFSVGISGSGYQYDLTGNSYAYTPSDILPTLW